MKFDLGFVKMIRRSRLFSRREGLPAFLHYFVPLHAVFLQRGAEMFSLEITKDYQELSEKAAELVAKQLKKKANSVLGLATGSTPLGCYEQLVKLYKAGELDFSEVHSVNLDEYRGLTAEDKNSYRHFMDENLFSKINIVKEHTHVPDGMEENREKACKDYDAKILSVGEIDLQILGLGLDGHIGFNEPADSFSKGTNCVRLTDETIESNQRFFRSKEEVPQEAYTMGIGSIFSAKKILLLVSGKAKAEILEKALRGPVTPRVPASILQFHKDLTVLADEEAASALS